MSINEDGAVIGDLCAALRAVIELHAFEGDDGTCRYDGHDWPCATIRCLHAAGIDTGRQG